MNGARTKRAFPILRMLAVVAMILGAAGLAFVPNAILPPELHDFTTGLATGMSVALVAMLVVYLVKPLRERLLTDACEDPHVQALNQRYLRQVAPAFGLYVLAVIAMRQAVGHALWLQVVLVLLPMTAVVLIVRAWRRYLADADELQRRIEIEALALAALLVSQLYLAGWFLLRAGLIHLDAADAMLWVFVLVVLMRAAARLWLQWKYR